MFKKISLYVIVALFSLTIVLGGVSCCSCKKMYKYKAEKESALERLKTTNYESAQKDSVINVLSKTLPQKIDTVKLEVIKEIHHTDTLILYNTQILQRIDTNVLILKNELLK